MSIVVGIPNPETGGTYEITGFTWGELERYLVDANYGPVLPRAVYMHHTYRPVAWPAISLRETVDLTAGVLRYFFSQGWRPFGKGPHLFCSAAGVALAWPVSHDGYHVIFHNELTLGVEFMYDGEVGPAPQWAIDGWIRICRALNQSSAGIVADRQHMRLHRDYTAGSDFDPVARQIDLAGADFTQYPLRKSCPGRQVFEAQIYPPLWAALHAPEVDDVILVPSETFPAGTTAVLEAGVTYSLYRLAAGASPQDLAMTQRKSDDGQILYRTYLGEGSGRPALARMTLNGDAAHAGILIASGWIISGWGPQPPIVLPVVPDPDAAAAAVRSDAAARLDRLAEQASADAGALRAS